MTEPTDFADPISPRAEPTQGNEAAAKEPGERAAGSRWRLQAVLFVATVISMFMAGAAYAEPDGGGDGSWRWLLANLGRGWTMAVPLLAILVIHELGHYVAARLHRVPASLPYFIPLPSVGFGTLGAVIAMRERIRSRNQLLDIGAAGPLAGLVVAVVVLVIGLGQSEVKELVSPSQMEGQCLLYLGLKRIILGPIAAGQDVYLSATAFAGWGGLLLTSLNLIPIGQLDGGHIAYALLGERQNRLAVVLHWSLLLVFAYNLLAFNDWRWGLIWVVWFVLLYAMRRMAGVNHPPTDPGELSPARRVVAVLCLLLFVALFMPTPMREL
jgi:membrane-associated protease RseP (regulator of RpoE activity)